MRFSDWKTAYIWHGKDEGESSRHFQNNRFYANLLLNTLENEFPSCQSIIPDEKFIGIVQKHVVALRDSGYGDEYVKATTAMASDPYKINAYADFVKQLMENNYLPNVKIFRASNDRLAVQFDNVKSREIFEVKLGHEIFTHNKFLSGTSCPQRDLKLTNILKFPYYKAGKGEPAVPFPSKGMRDKFYNLLILSRLTEIYSINGQETTIYFNDKSLHQPGYFLLIPLPEELANTDINYLQARAIEFGDKLNVPLSGIMSLITIVLDYANSLLGEDEKPVESVKGKSQLISSQGFIAKSTTARQGESTNSTPQCLLQ